MMKAKVHGVIGRGVKECYVNDENILIFDMSDGKEVPIGFTGELKGIVPIDLGGTNAKNPADARKNLGITPGNIGAATSAEVDVERKRINNLASLKNGSTTGDAELTDIRIGYDGATYPTAGEAVRGQVGELKSDIDYIHTYKLNENDFEIGNKWVEKGELVVESTRKDRISSKNTIKLYENNCISSLSDSIQIIVYRKNGDSYESYQTIADNKSYICIDKIGDYLLVIGILPERSKEITDVNELLKYVHITNCFQNKSIKKLSYSTENDVIRVRLDSSNHYSYFKMPRKIDVGEYFKIKVKSYNGATSGYLKKYHEIMTCNGFGFKQVNDLCGLQRMHYLVDETYNVNGVSINITYYFRAERDFDHLGLYTREEAETQFEIELTIEDKQSISSDILTVMTYNADRFEGFNSNEEMHSVILEKYNVDIVGIQEFRETIGGNSIYTNVFDNYKYRHMNSAIPNPSGIVSKKKLFSVSDILFDTQSTNDSSATEYKEIRGYSKCYIYINGKKVCWLNTHLDLNANTRYSQINELIQVMLSEEYAILTGDLNTSGMIDKTSTEWTNSLKQFCDNGLKFVNGSDDYGFNWTWSGSTYGNTETKVLDNIVVTPNIKILDVFFDKTRMEYKGENYIVEHNPVIAKLLIN